MVYPRCSHCRESNLLLEPMVDRPDGMAVQTNIRLCGHCMKAIELDLPPAKPPLVGV